MRIEVINKINFYTNKPVKILRIEIFGKVIFYHLTYNKFI